MMFIEWYDVVGFALGGMIFFSAWIWVIFEEHESMRKDVDDSKYHDDHKKIGA